MKLLPLLVIMGGLVGCADYGLTGTIFIATPDHGAKGGMTFSEDGTTVNGTFVDDHGNNVGGSVFFPKSRIEVVPEK